MEIAPVEELLTFAALAPERLEEKSGPKVHFPWNGEMECYVECYMECYEHGI